MMESLSVFIICSIAILVSPPLLINTVFILYFVDTLF